MRRWKLKSYVLNLFHQEGTPECIARGAALGLLAAFMIPIGLHTISILLLGFVFRCNKITAMGVTFLIANELTVAFIYPLQCIIGSYVMMEPLGLHEVKNIFMGLYHDFRWRDLMMVGREIGVPFLAGGAIISALTIPPGYYMVLGLVNRTRARIAARRQRRQKRRTVAADACRSNKVSSLDN